MLHTLPRPGSGLQTLPGTGPALPPAPDPAVFTSAVARYRALEKLREFRSRLHDCLALRADALFELADADLCADHAVTSLVQLSLEPEFTRGHGALYDVIDHGLLERALAGLPADDAAQVRDACARWARLRFAVDATACPRPGARCSPGREHVHSGACHCKGSSRTAPGWEYQFTAVAGHLRTAWAALVARELMVSLWYPAATPDGRPAPYMTSAESELQLASRGMTGVPPDALSTVETSAVSDATPAGQQRSLPLVVLSPGFTGSRSTLTALAEDLASHGYVVAGIDHTYESHATAFPDGRVTTCLAREARRPGSGFWEKVAAGRAADVSFVLGELTGVHPAWPAAGLIDPSRIAVAGHSAGGAAAIAAMVADPRIRAGIDMDGSTAAPIPDGGLSRPFMFLGKQSDYTPGSGSAATTPRDWKRLRAAVTTWERDWELLTGWKRWLVVAGAVHASFTDLALLADGLGLDIGAGLSGARSLDITRAYVGAFFDQHLRGRPQTLLDQPSPRYPEVAFCSP